MENDNITLLKEKLRLAELNSDMALEELIVILESVQGTFDKKHLINISQQPYQVARKP